MIYKEIQQSLILTIESFNNYLERDFNREYNHLLGVFINYLQKSLKGKVNHKTILDLSINNIGNFIVNDNKITYIRFTQCKTWNGELKDLVDLLIASTMDINLKQINSYGSINDKFNEIFERIENVKF